MIQDVVAPITTSAAQLVQLIRSGQMSPTEAVELAIGRVKARNASLNAVVHFDPQAALESARGVEARLRAGDPVGGLAGVPTMTTDLFSSYPGWPGTLGGIPAIRNIGTNCSLYPKRMEAAGAVLLGYTNSSPLGFTSVCDNRAFGPTANPFDLTRNSGAAAGGSAAAVADGLVPIAGALDGGGWIRTAAAWCGVFGFQASHGRIARITRPSAFEVSPFAYDGAITRTVEDAALALNALVGYEREDPFSVASGIDWTRALTTSIDGCRIGFAPRLGGFPVAPGICEVLTDAVAVLEAQGARVVPLEIEFSYSADEISAAWRRMVSTRMAGALNGLKRRGIDLAKDFRDQIPADVWASIEHAQSLGITGMQRDQQIRTAVYDGINRALADVDVIACPSAGAPPVANGSPGGTCGPTEVDGFNVDPVVGWCLGFLTNFSGHPSASLPAGFADGLPVGLQLIGQRHGDFPLLSVCAAFEAARPWAASYDRCDARAIGVA